MSFSFHPEAEEEFNDAVEYYESIESGLGYDFALEVYAAIKRSVDFPKAWAELEGDVRRSLVRRFPYGILYSDRERWVIHRGGDEAPSQARILEAQKACVEWESGERTPPFELARKHVGWAERSAA